MSAVEPSQTDRHMTYLCWTEVLKTGTGTVPNRQTYITDRSTKDICNCYNRYIWALYIATRYQTTFFGF